MADTDKQMLRIFKRDLANSEQNKELHDELVGKRSAEFNGEKYGNETKGKASVVSRDIKRAASWQHSSVISPFVTGDDIVKCTPSTAKSTNVARKAELLLNYQFCRDFDRYHFVSDSFKILQREGTVIGKVSWEFEEEEVEVEVPVEGLIPVQDPEQYRQMVAQGMPPYEMGVVGSEFQMQMQTVVNRPRVEIVRNSMLWIDPTAENTIEDAKFVIYKYKSSLSELRADGRYKNLDSIKEGGEIIYDTESPYYNDETFTFEDKPRQQVEVVEYWGDYDMNEDGIAEPIVCTWVGDTIIRMEDNPMPDKKHPFVSCAYDSQPFSIYGFGIGDVISVDQKIKTGIKRAMLDTLDASTNGMRGIKKGTLDVINKGKFSRGENFEYLGSNNDIWEGSFNSIPADVLGFYGMIDGEIQTQTGVTVDGQTNGSNALGTSKTGALNAVALREIDVSRNYKESFLIPILRKWYSMNAEWMEPGQAIRITDDEFTEIDPSDLQGRIDIKMNISTPEVDNEKSNNIAFMLQTLGQSLPPEITNMLLSAQAELKDMPELAKAIREYKPQPDPFEESMKQLELEKMQSEINERNSRATENDSDIRLKEAKADNEEAKARKVESDADMVDLDFLRKQDGTERKENLDDERYKHRADMQSADQQAALGYMSGSAIQKEAPKPTGGK